MFYKEDKQILTCLQIGALSGGLNKEIQHNLSSFALGQTPWTRLSSFLGLAVLPKRNDGALFLLFLELCEIVASFGLEILQ